MQRYISCFYLLSKHVQHPLRYQLMSCATSMKEPCGFGVKRVGELILNRTQTACYFFVPRSRFFSSIVGVSIFMLLVLSSHALWMPFLRIWVTLLVVFSAVIFVLFVSKIWVV